MFTNLLTKLFTPRPSHSGTAMRKSRAPGKPGKPGNKIRKKVGKLTMQNPGGIVSEYFRDKQKEARRAS